MKLFRLLSYRMCIIKKIWNITKNRFFIEFIKMSIYIINIIFAEIYLDKLIFDSLANGSSFNLTVIFIGIFFVMMSINISFNNWYNMVFVLKSNLKIQSAIKMEIFNKLVKIDLICFDDPEFYNEKVWISNDGDEKYIQVLNSFFSFFTSIFTCFALIISALILEPALLVFSSVFIIASYFINDKYTKLNFKFDKESVSIKRKKDYPGSVFFSVAAAKDIRITGLPKILKNKYNQYIQKYREFISVYGKRKSKLYLLMLYIELFFGTWIPLLYIAVKAILTKAYSVGTVSASISVISSMKKGVKNIINSISQMQEQNLYIDLYNKFMAMEESIKSNESGKDVSFTANSIRLEHISYKYPNSSGFVLKDINMEIKSGDKVAIVGNNGAGKTTLIKLIMRLYIPEEGTMYLDNEPMSNYKLSSVRNRFGVIFQDFQLYALNVIENVLMDENNDCLIKTNLVDDALMKSGLYNRIYEEKTNIMTNILKEYDEDGLILSGGQAQKLAISRVFAKDCGIIIMDEPSSALDPISEHEMHLNMLEAAKDKTIILISHRLSTTRDADKIYYLENGEIVEEGNHEKLMSLNGKYAYMYNLQADNYMVNN